MQDVITIWDLLLTPFYLFGIIMIARNIQLKHERQNPAYKYFTWGIVAKIVGAISICLIYVYYYKGGDTLNYYQSASSVTNMLFKSPSVFLSTLMGDTSPEVFGYYDNDTDWPIYWYDGIAMFVSRLITPICVLSFKSFIVSSILLAFICYSGIWRLYLLFCEQFPHLRKELAISILFVPSVVFWGSGLLKDTITISAVGWYSYSFYKFFIKKKYNVRIFLIILLSSYLLLAIKPYILFALLPGSIIWFFNDKASRVRHKFLRVILAPLMFVLAIMVGFFVLTELGDVLGIYSIDKVFDRAVVVQQDLKKDYYEGNTFDIGDFEPTPLSMLSKAHLAIAAALFRPYLWDVKNPVMFVSALENTYILGLTLFLLFKLKFLRFFDLIGKHPLLLFSIIFALFFAFSVGLTTPNFGSLVRLKIPCIPFYISSLFVLKDLYDKEKKSYFKLATVQV